MAPSEKPVFSMLCSVFGLKMRETVIPQTRMKPHFLISEGAIFWPVVFAERAIQCRKLQQLEN